MGIKEYREKIDEIDDILLEKFQERMKVVKEIGEYKKEKGLPVTDEKREEELLKRIAEKATPELSEYAGEFFDTIIKISKDYQKRGNK